MNNKIFKRMEMLSGLTNTTKIDKFLKKHFINNNKINFTHIFNMVKTYMLFV